jgi:membrane dipeptidase
VSCASINSVDIKDTMRNIMGYIQAVDRNPRQLCLISSPDDLREAKRSGRVAYIFHMQGVSEIGSELLWIEILARLGVRYMALTYTYGNQFGSGCGETDDTGVTYLGRQVLREMQHAGVIVDLSHLGFRTAREVLDATEGPVVLSHSSPYDLVQTPRNAPADVMKAVAERRGLMGIPVYAPMLDANNGKFPDIETILDHIEYAVEKMGIDHVAMGSDHSEVSSIRWQYYLMRHGELIPDYYRTEPYFSDPKYHSALGFGSPADMPKITLGLVKRGFSDDAIKKIMGENHLRVMDEVWGGKLKSLASPDLAGSKELPPVDYSNVGDETPAWSPAAR